MGAHRERQHEDRPEQAAKTAPAPALPAPPAPGFSPHTLNGAGVIALQRLVGNAAVAEMMQARKRPEVREAGQAGVGKADALAPAVEGEAGAAGGDPLGALGSGLLAGTGFVGGPPGASAIEAALEIAASADASSTGATPSEVNGVNPAPTGVTARDPKNAEAAGALAQPGTPAAAAAAPTGATARARKEAVPAPVAPGGAAAPAITVARAVAAPPAPSPAGQAAPGARGDIRNPHDDPGFRAMKGATKGAGVRSKTHQPAPEGAATAQGAAVPPGNDIPSQAAAAQVEEMGKQQPGVFDKKAFVAAVKKAIDAATPKSLEEVEEFKGSGKAGQAKEEVQGLVKGGKKESEKNIKEATDAPPDQSKATPKPVTPMVNDEPGAPPADVGAADAMPKPRPAQQTDLSGGPAEVDAKMAEAEVTDEQLQKSNEPAFTGALEARDAARKDSATAPGEYRAKEQDVLAKGRGEAEGAAGAELQGMHGTRAQALAKVVGKKGETKSADEQKRAKVATDIQTIYDRTKADVTKTLDALDGKVDAAFTKGESAARSQFENYVDKRMSDYKDKRYSGLLGKGKWLKDKVVGMPDEVNRFYEEGKRGYLTSMDGVIGEVADIVGTELTAARTRIAGGRAEVQKYVAKLPADLRDVGKEAADKLESQFEQLSSDVDSKQEVLVDKLAQKYVESRDALDARIEELRAANKGWVNKALDAVVGVVNTILKLKDMLMSVLSRAADAIGDIIKDPIGFLGNLIDGVKGGLNKFVGRIGTHLQEGLMGWLFGALGGAGLTMPKSLDFQGILDLVLQVLGLTYQNVRARFAKKVGEPLAAKMEKTVDVLKDFASKGIAGAWEWIKDKIGDLEDMVLGQIKEFVIEKVIKSGIVWIISLLNPAAAFVKACKAIYDIVMFIVERGSQIMEFVNSIIDSIGAIAKGSVGVVVDKIEGALAKALPLAISFLASLLGLGGISDKIRSVIDKVRSPINKAIDVVVGGAVKTFKKMFGGPIAKAKKKYEQGKAFVKGKADAGKKFVKGKAQAIKDRLTGGGKKPADPTGKGSGEQPDAVPDEEIREPFDLLGEDHSIYTDASGGLMMASTGAKPVSAIEKLTSLHQMYKKLDEKATTTSRHRLIQQMVELIKNDPSLISELADQDLGDPPNLGDVRPHGSQTARFMKPPGSEASLAPLWELESEHVIPRSYVNAFFEALKLDRTSGGKRRPTSDGHAAPRKGDEYARMHTVMIYKGAADKKTEGQGSDNSVYSELVKRSKEVMDAVMESDQPAAHFDFAIDTIVRMFAGYGANAKERTFEAVVEEHGKPNGDSTNGKIRKRPAGPPPGKIEQAFARQTEDVRAMLERRLKPRR